MRNEFSQEKAPKPFEPRGNTHRAINGEGGVTADGDFMTVTHTVQQHPASVDAYIRHGWSLVPIPPSTKGPRTQGWNLKENALQSQADLPHGYGIGLAHAYSGTMALDIDNEVLALAMLAEHGIDLSSIASAPDAVLIHSGKPGHGKILYTMPFGLALPTKKVVKDGVTVYELRCATAGGLTVQDVLPPSIHPETHQPYQWAGAGHWTRIPMIPQPLLDLWLSMVDQDAKQTIPTTGMIDTSWDEIKGAMAVIPADCTRDDWISVGMALHWVGTQTGQLDCALQLWQEWSAQSQNKYPGDREILHQWGSFRPEKMSTVKLGTLFHIAKKNGWVRPVPDVSALFGSTAPETKAPEGVLLGMRPNPPSMNLDLWPEILRRRSLEVSESVGCDPLVPLFAGLAAACGVIDARTRLELMPGFKVPPVLWLMTLGDPADKKSPGSRPMLAPLRAIEAEDRPRYGKEMLEWEGQEAAYASAKKNFLEWSASPEGMLSGDQAPVVPQMPPQPVPLKITVSDITSQKLVRQAADRPRGLLCHLDEMNSWVRKLTDKTSGEDRSAWVVSYESEHYEMDRVGAGSIHCENLAVSIYGNIQPQVFKSNLASLSADGLLQRFIPGVLRSDKTKLGNPIPECFTSAAAWENTLRLTYALPPQTYRLSPEAFTAFREFQAWYEDAKQDERLLSSGVEYMTAFGKIEGLAGRLILMFHVLESPFSPEVGTDIVSRVVDLVRGYVIPAYRYALGTVGGALVGELDEWVMDHVIQCSGETQTVTLSSIKHSARRYIEHKPDWQRNQVVQDAMVNLELAGWVAQIESEPNKGKITWAINPKLCTMFSDHRKAVIKAKQRHVDYIYRHAYAKGIERKIVKGYEGDEE